MTVAAENIEKSNSTKPIRGAFAEIAKRAAQFSKKVTKKHSTHRLLTQVFIVLSLLITNWLPYTTSRARAHGFNANHVDIVKTYGRKYRVIIRYTHVEVGEYRVAHIDFDNKEEAIKAFQDLAKGADFFLGDIKKSIHFHTPPESNSPY